MSKKCNIRLNGLSEKSIQGDKEIRDLFRNLGVESNFKKGPLFLTKKNNILTQNIIDLKNTPDLYQPLKCVSLALQKDIIFKGISTLKDKESDRIKATNNELLKLKSSKIINTHNDHRIAMSFTPLSLIFGEIQINNPEVVQKSYVNFWKDIIKAGFKISSSNLTSN